LACGNIYLTGFMGAGKSEVGRRLARKLGREFLDTDELVERRSGRRISEIFAEFGEERFREMEHAAVREASELSRAVVALGGGAITRERNLKLIRETGVVVYLKLTPEAILERVKDDNTRPLLAGLDNKAKLERIRSLLSKRSEFYNKADLIIECASRSADEIADEIASKLEKMGF